MPIYRFKETSSGEIKDFWMKMSELEEETERLKSEGWERVLDAPAICYTSNMSISRLDDGFNDRLKEIKEYGGKSSTVETK
jgi:hypothetical protein